LHKKVIFNLKKAILSLNVILGQNITIFGIKKHFYGEEETSIEIKFIKYK
jgi:hypothetical protein